MEKKLPMKEVLALGFFMFALFLGAGNIIFPPLLGQQAGQSLWAAVLGFLVTGVGLPLLAVITISVQGDLDELSKKVHPVFLAVFPIIIYLTIGPFFGIPRTATVVYEIGVLPFLTEESKLSLFIATLIFFLLTFWLSLNPAKLVDRIGKLITPVLFILIVVIAIRAFVWPIESIGIATGTYIEQAFSSGFLEGFLTMDAIAALVFGLVIINRIQEMGVRAKADIRSYTIKAGILAGIGLSFVYITLSYIGATSVHAVGYQDNGGTILAVVTSILFGPLGTILLALVIIGACLTTSIGLVSACGEFLTKRFTKLSYPLVIGMVCLFSFVMSNMGLSQLISVSLPVLIMIYPVAIVLIILSLFHSLPSSVYIGAIIGAGLISIYDGLKEAGFEHELISNAFSYLPLFEHGVGWLLPSIVGGLLGFLIAKNKNV